MWYILYSISVATIIFIWLDTEAFQSYFKYLNIKNIFNFNEFFSLYNEGEIDNYAEFLNHKYNNFFTKLISCPICLGFWLNLPILFISIINWLPCVAFTWIFYSFLKKNI